MDVRIDQRSERGWRFEDWVERDPQLTKHVDLGAEAGSDDDLVDFELEGLAIQLCADPQPIAGPIDALGRERREQLEPARIDRSLGRQAERAARRKLVVQAAAQELVEPIAAQRPDNAQFGRCLLKPQQIEGHVGGGVPGAKD